MSVFKYVCGAHQRENDSESGEQFELFERESVIQELVNCCLCTVVLGLADNKKTLTSLFLFTSAAGKLKIHFLTSIE